MDIPTKTSQQADGGHHLTEGTSPQVPTQQYGDEPSGPPGPVTEPVKGETFKIDALSTSQQRAGDHDKPEGDKTNGKA